MKGFDYTKKEFCEEHADPAVNDFFKHTDRKISTSPYGPNFYKHWDIKKEFVQKSWANQTYEIPVEVNTLYAELIRIFNFTYGADRRGHSPKKPIEKYSIEKYQTYLKELDLMLEDRLEPYQSCMIKNYDSYQQTKAFQSFLPLLLERIAMLMAVCFDYGSDDGHDTYYITTEQIDLLIESIIRKRLLAQDTHPCGRLHSFEDAISGTFQTLTIAQETPPPHKTVFSNTLDQKILEERLKFRNTLQAHSKQDISSSELKKYRQALIDTLNKTAAPFIEKQQRFADTFETNVQQIKNELDSFWDNSSQISKRELQFVEKYHHDLVHFLDYLSDCALPVDVIKEFTQKKLLEYLQANNYQKVRNCADILLQLENFQDELETIKEVNPQTEGEWKNLIKDLVDEYRNAFNSGSIQENDRAHLRKETCNYYAAIKNSKPYQNLLSSLEEAIGNWLPNKLI